MSLAKLLIKTGDMVKVIAGDKNDKGKVAKVLEVNRKELRVRVEGIGMVKRHKKGTAGEAGTIVSKERFIHYSNIQLVDQDSGKAYRGSKWKLTPVGDAKSPKIARVLKSASK
jgi:large subunit ribosomal protein L24